MCSSHGAHGGNVRRKAMYAKEGTNKVGERIALSIEDDSYHVIWYGLCGYDMVEFPFEHEGQAILFYEAALAVEEYEVD